MLPCISLPARNNHSHIASEILRNWNTGVIQQDGAGTKTLCLFERQTPAVVDIFKQWQSFPCDNRVNTELVFIN